MIDGADSTGQMDWHDGFGSRRYKFFYLRGIDDAVRSYVAEEWRGAHEAYGVCGRDERQCGDYDFIAFTDVDGAEPEHEGVCSGAYADCVLTIAACREGRFQGSDFGAVNEASVL